MKEEHLKEDIIMSEFVQFDKHYRMFTVGDDKFPIDSFSRLEAHAKKRIIDAWKKAEDFHEKHADISVDSKFNQLLTTRMCKMTKKDKLLTTIILLDKLGYSDMARMYYAKITLNDISMF